MDITLEGGKWEGVNGVTCRGGSLVGDRSMRMGATPFPCSVVLLAKNKKCKL